MGLADRMEDVPADFDPVDFTWGVDCGRTVASEWCFYQEPHEHGFACDRPGFFRQPGATKTRELLGLAGRANPKFLELLLERIDKLPR